MGEQVKRYEPFPDGQVPEGWPIEYVSAEDYAKLRRALELCIASHRALNGTGDDAENVRIEAEFWLRRV